jgi:hypothetical protein
MLSNPPHEGRAPVLSHSHCARVDAAKSTCDSPSLTKSSTPQQHLAASATASLSGTPDLCLPSTGCYTQKSCQPRRRDPRICQEGDRAVLVGVVPDRGVLDRGGLDLDRVHLLIPISGTSQACKMDILLSCAGLPTSAPDAWVPVTTAEFIEALHNNAYHDAMAEADVQAMADARAAWEAEDWEAEDEETEGNEEAQDDYYKPVYGNGEWGYQMDGDDDCSETAADYLETADDDCGSKGVKAGLSTSLDDRRFRYANSKAFNTTSRPRRQI